MTPSFAALPCPASPLRHLDPRWKLAAFTFALLAAALLEDLFASVAALAASLFLAWLGCVPRRWFLARLGLLLLILSPFVLSLVFLLPEESWESAIRLTLALTAKAITLLTLALVLLTSAPLPDTLKAAHALRVPGLLVQLLALTYRYVFLVVGELARLRIALRARGFRNRPSLHTYRTIGHAAGSLLIRSHERGERVAQAMRCRGFDGHYRSLTGFRTRFADAVFFFLVTAGAVGLLLWDLGQRGQA